MSKDFVNWTKEKSRLESLIQSTYFYEREVWWTAIGQNVGFEEDGKGSDFSRPVLIIRKYNEHFFLGLPLTSRPKFGNYYHRFENSPGYTTALLSQLRTFDAKRLINKDGSVSPLDFAIIKCELIAQIVK